MTLSPSRQQSSHDFNHELETPKEETPNGRKTSLTIWEGRSARGILCRLAVWPHACHTPLQITESLLR